MKLLKKTVYFFLVLMMLFSTASTVIANDDIKVIVNGNYITFDVAPQLINGRTMVPIRAIVEALGAQVYWDDATQSASLTKETTTVILTINNAIMYVNGNAVTLDSPACLIGGRTLVPIRAISEAFGTKVDWDASTSTVVITSSSTQTLKMEDIDIRVKPNGGTLVLKNNTPYPYVCGKGLINGALVVGYYIDWVEYPNITVNPGETKTIGAAFLFGKGDNNGVNSFGNITIEWQGKKYEVDFTVNGITDLYEQ